MKLRLRDYVILVLAIAAVAVVATRNADASEKPKRYGGDVTQSNDMNNQTAGDVSLSAGLDATLNGGDFVGGDTTLAMDSQSIVVAAPGLGDVDIAACLGSTQWSLLVGGKQKLVLNQVCMAEFYLKQGRYDLAAQSLCNQPEIVAEYENESQCEVAHDFTPAPSPAPTAVARYEPEETHEEDMEIVQSQHSGLLEQLDYVTAQLEEVKARPPEIIYQQAEPAFSEDQKKAAWLALVGNEEDEK